MHKTFQIIFSKRWLLNLGPLYFLFLLSSCAAYKRDILVRTDRGYSTTPLTQALAKVEENYLIQPDDFLEIQVNTNRGERLIDPNFELMDNVPNRQMLFRDQFFMVQPDGKVKFPMVGEVPLQGLSLRSAEKVLEKAYAEFYDEPFVNLTWVNKRIILLGALGGSVITLPNENISLLEALAMADPVDQRLARVDRIRLIRGDLRDPEIYEIDLSTVEGLKASAIPVLPGDVIYIEPVRRVAVETLREFSPILSILSTITALILLIDRLSE